MAQMLKELLQAHLIIEPQEFCYSNIDNWSYLILISYRILFDLTKE